MKKIILFITAVLMVMVLCSCDANPTESSVVKDQPSMFIEVEESDSWIVVYHKETKVMYVVSRCNYNSGNFTLLVNPDGTPMLWEE